MKWVLAACLTTFMDTNGLQEPQHVVGGALAARKVIFKDTMWSEVYCEFFFEVKFYGVGNPTCWEN